MVAKTQNINQDQYLSAINGVPVFHMTAMHIEEFLNSRIPGLINSDITDAILTLMILQDVRQYYQQQQGIQRAIADTILKYQLINAVIKSKAARERLDDGIRRLEYYRQQLNAFPSTKALTHSFAESFSELVVISENIRAIYDQKIDVALDAHIAEIADDPRAYLTTQAIEGLPKSLHSSIETWKNIQDATQKNAVQKQLIHDANPEQAKALEKFFRQEHIIDTLSQSILVDDEKGGQQRIRVIEKIHQDANQQIKKVDMKQVVDVVVASHQMMLDIHDNPELSTTQKQQALTQERVKVTTTVAIHAAPFEGVLREIKRMGAAISFFEEQQVSNPYQAGADAYRLVYQAKMADLVETNKQDIQQLKQQAETIIATIQSKKQAIAAMDNQTLRTQYQDTLEHLEANFTGEPPAIPPSEDHQKLRALNKELHQLDNDLQVFKMEFNDQLNDMAELDDDFSHLINDINQEQTIDTSTAKAAILQLLGQQNIHPSTMVYKEIEFLIDRLVENKEQAAHHDLQKLQHDEWPSFWEEQSLTDLEILQKSVESLQTALNKDTSISPIYQRILDLTLSQIGEKITDQKAHCIKQTPNL